MNNDNCIFCKIASKQIPAEIIYENDDVVAIFDNSPAALGHMLVIPKKHVADIYEADEQTICAVFKAVSKISNALKRSTDIKGMNILQNNGLIAGQTVFHLHVHLIPRSENDAIDIHWEKASPAKSEIDKLIAALKNEI